ncbi:MAG: N-acetylmuramoyl-L-alanine amidase [bacterium]
MFTKKIIFILPFISLFTIASPAKAQFDDIARILPESPRPKVSTVDGRYQVQNTLSDYQIYGEIEGVMIQFTSEAQPEISFRFRQDGGQWSGWQEARILAEPFSNRYYAAYRGELAINSAQFAYRVRVASGEVEILKTGIFTKDLETYPKVDIYPRPKQSAIRKPYVISRQEWGAKNPKERYAAHPYYDKLTLHHAAGFRAENLQEGILQMQAIQKLHQDIRGWNDIGYHFVVDRAGNIYQGRPEYVIGAHVGGANTGNIGVCVLGCYHPPEANCNDRITQASLDSLIVLYGWIADTYSYDPNVLLGHRDYFGTTACPGDNLWPLLPFFRTEIAGYLERDGVPNIFFLTQNYPNPFNPGTTISYHLPQSDNVELAVYSLMGHKIRHLVNESQAAGEHFVEWDGRDDAGNRVASGPYFYVLRTSTQHEKRRMMLVR